MPAIARTSRDAIVRAAAALLDDGGPDAVTIAAVAAAVGVRGPSLYKHVAHRDELLRLVSEAAVARLGAEVAAAVDDSPDPASALRAAARALRVFALGSPWAYALVFGPSAPELRPSAEALAASAQPILDTVSALVGESNALPAARTVTAWANGFLTMELGGAFRLGGDVEEAFDWGLDTLVAALQAGGSRPVGRS